MTKDEHVNQWIHIAEYINSGSSHDATEKIKHYMHLLNKSEKIAIFGCDLDCQDIYEFLYKSPEFKCWDLENLKIPFATMERFDECAKMIFRYVSTCLDLEEE